MWSRFLRQAIIRAAAFWTDYNLAMSRFGAPKRRELQRSNFERTKLRISLLVSWKLWDDIILCIKPSKMRWCKKKMVENQPCTFGFVALLISVLKPFFLVAFRWIFFYFWAMFFAWETERILINSNRIWSRKMLDLPFVISHPHSSTNMLHLDLNTSFWSSMSTILWTQILWQTSFPVWTRNCSSASFPVWTRNCSSAVSGIP